MGLTSALNYRPVRVIGFIAAAHSFIYGLGFLLAIGGFGKTVLYTALGPQSVIVPFGLALLITGGFLMFGFVRNNPKTIRAGSCLSGIVWLFAAIMYMINGGWLLSLGIGLPWTLLAFYLGYAHGNRVSIMNYDQSDVAKRDTANEDQL